MTKPHATMANILMLNNMTEKPSTCFSYLIEPTTPCVLGTDNYDEHPANDDEFFLTAGGIIHSCPNIYELSMENAYDYRKRTSCDQLMLFMGKQTTSIENYLKSYNTELDRYAIRARFQPILSSASTESMNSEIELYNERHAHGLSRKDHTTMSMYSSFLPTTWKSDNYLLLMSVLHHQSLLATSMDSNKRSRSYEILIE